MADRINVPIQFSVEAIKGGRAAVNAYAAYIEKTVNGALSSAFTSPKFKIPTAAFSADLQKALNNIKIKGLGTPIFDALEDSLDGVTKKAIKFDRTIQNVAAKISKNLTSKSLTDQQRGLAQFERTVNLIGQLESKQRPAAFRAFYSEISKYVDGYAKSVEDAQKKQDSLTQAQDRNARKARSRQARDDRASAEFDRQVRAKDNKADRRGDIQGISFRASQERRDRARQEQVLAAQDSAQASLGRQKGIATFKLAKDLRQNQRATQIRRENDAIEAANKARATSPDVLDRQIALDAINARANQRADRIKEVNSGGRIQALKDLNTLLGVQESVRETLVRTNDNVGLTQAVNDIAETKAKLDKVQKAKITTDVSQAADLFDIANAANKELGIARQNLDVLSQTAKVRQEDKKALKEITSLQQKAAEIVGVANKTQQLKPGSQAALLNTFATAKPEDILAGRKAGTSALPTNQDIGQLIKSERQLQSLNKTIQKNSLSLERFGELAGLAFQRFGAFLAGTFIINQIVGAFNNAARAALDFEKTQTKIQQILETNRESALGIGKAIRDASIRTGVDVTKIGGGVLEIAQAGFKDPRQLKQTADLLAKTQLGATFGDIGATTEGLISIIGQFNLSLDDTAEILDIVNKLSADYAIESGDFFEAVKKAGSAFSLSGGNFKDFAELLTLLRSSTRESAGTLGNFFKSGITSLTTAKSQRLLRGEGIDTNQPILEQLRQLAPVLARKTPNERLALSKDLVGRFQGARLAKVTDELQNDSKLRDSIKQSSGSLDRSIVPALENVGTSLNRITNSLIDAFTRIINDESIRKSAKSLANFSEYLIKGSDALGQLGEVLLKLIVIIGAFKVGDSVGRIGRGLVDRIRGLPIGEVGPVLPLRQRVRSGLASRRSVAGLAGGAAIAAPIGLDLARESGLIGSQTAEVLGGAANLGSLGALIGTAILPGIGTAIGAGVGALTGAIIGLTSVTQENTKAQQVELLRRASESENPQKAILESFLSSNGIIRDNIGPESFRQVGLGGFVAKVPGRVLSNVEKNALQAQQINDAFTKNDRLADDKKNPIIDAFLKEVVGSSIIAAQDNLNKLLSSGSSQPLNKNEIQSFIIQDAIESISSLSDGIIDPKVVRALITKAISDSRITLGDFKVVNKELSVNIDQLQAGNDTLVVAFSQIGSALKNFGKTLLETERQLAIISADPQGLQKILPSSDNTALLQSAGITNILDTVKRDKLFSTELDKFIAPDFLQAARDFGSNRGTVKTSALDEGNNFKEFIKTAFNKSSPETRALALGFESLFTNLAAISGKSLGQIFTSFQNFRGSAEEFVEELTGTESILGKIAEAVRASINNFNRRLEIERQLADSALSTNQALFALSDTIRTSLNNAADRGVLQSAFLNNTTDSNLLQQQARISAGRAGLSSFGNSQTFIQDLLRSGNARNTAVTNAQNSNLKGGFDFKIFEEANRSQIEYAKKQQELAQRISELDTRIGQAASATDGFRQAILNFRSDLEGSGKSVRSFTRIELANAFTAFRKFNQVGLEGLNKVEFGALEKLLGTVGNLNLGNGVTGSQLLGNIDRQFGLNFAAAIRAQQNNTSFDTEFMNVQQELEALQQAQINANAQEQQLRQEQLALFQVQKQSISIDQLYNESQITLLNQIAVGTEPLAEIRDKIQKLFGTDAQKVILDNLNAAPSNPNLDKFLRENQDRLGQDLKTSTSEAERQSIRESIEALKRFKDSNPNDVRDNVRLPNLPSTNVPRFNTPSQISVPVDITKQPYRNPDGVIPAENYIPKDYAPNINIMNSDLVTAIDKFHNSVLKLNDKTTEQANGEFLLNISPVQVNVALTAPDILKLAGPEIKASIMEAIGQKLSQIFSDDIEKSGKIKDGFGGN